VVLRLDEIFNPVSATHLKPELDDFPSVSDFGDGLGPYHHHRCDQGHVDHDLDSVFRSAKQMVVG
jgi:hypothetical protein